MGVTAGNDWDDFLTEETSKDYYKELRKFLVQEYRSRKIYPPMDDIFNAFKFTPLSSLKAVILGQDPYINENEAHGLSFSVHSGKVTPSLKNIFNELESDLGIKPPNSGVLTRWAESGVMLLNAVLTVRAGVSKSHAGKGWETFTDAAIRKINERDIPVVFLLWGNDAKKKSALITNPRHKILTAPHPSPLAGGGFAGCKHFSKANEFLAGNGLPVIDWVL